MYSVNTIFELLKQQKKKPHCCGFF